MLTCLLLAFGTITLAGAVLVPLQMVATWVAPEWHASGYETAANAVYVASEHGVPVVCLVTGLIASTVIPLKLRHAWPAILSAIGAGNSFKPNPLRGPA